MRESFNLPLEATIRLINVPSFKETYKQHCIGFLSASDARIRIEFNSFHRLLLNRIIFYVKNIQ